MATPAHDIAHRLSRFKRTRNPSDLWPGLTEGARVAAARELERVARAVLAGEAGVRIDALREHAPYALSIAGHTTGMGPLMARWAEDGLVCGDVDVLAYFAEQLRHGRRRFSRMDDEVRPVFTALLARDITPLVLKGFHTSQAYFAEPGARRMADIDLYVPAQRIADVEEALVQAGFEPDGPRMRPYRRDWIRSDIDPGVYSIEFLHEQSRWSLEVHASLDRMYHPGAVARLDREQACVTPFMVGSHQVLSLGQPLLFVMLACHCSQELDSSRLLRVVELVHVVRTDTNNGRLAWDDVISMLRRTGAARYAYPALALVEQLAPGTIDARVLALCQRASTRAALHTVARLVPAGGSADDRGVLRQMMWTHGPVSFAQRVLRSVWPASFTRPGDVIPGWRVRMRRLQAGLLSLRAPDERRTGATPERAAARTPERATATRE